MALRIALIIYGDLSTTSGGFLYDRMLVQRLRSAGAQVEIIALPWRSYVRHLFDNFSQSLLECLAARGRYDIVLQDELNHPSLFLLNWRLRRQQGRPPLVSIVHHLRSDEQHPPYLRAVYRTVEGIYLRSVDGFICNSESTRARVRAHRNGHLDGVTAYPAANHIGPPAAERVHALIAERCRHSSPLQVLFVGNVIPRKGLHTLLVALGAHMRAEFRLHVAGSLETDPAYAAQIARAVRRLGLEQRTALYGSVSIEQLRDLYRTCDILAVPSYEGFGIVYLEAMSFGMPVIAATTGAAHEIVTDRIDGFLVPPGDAKAIGDAISALAADRTLLARMGEAARKRYDRHPTWHETFSQTQAWLWQFARQAH